MGVQYTPDYVEDLEIENDKLRKLLRDAYWAMCAAYDEGIERPIEGRADRRGAVDLLLAINDAESLLGEDYLNDR